ncbi:9955_t:CDS:2, partial [Acaulospora morrowiae]
SLRHQNSNSELSHSKKQLQPQSPNVSGRMTPSRHGHRPSISSISVASVVAEREQVRPASPAPSKESLLSNQPSSDLTPLYCLSPPHSRPKPVTNPATLLTDEVWQNDGSKMTMCQVVSTSHVTFNSICGAEGITVEGAEIYFVARTAIIQCYCFLMAPKIGAVYGRGYARGASKITNEYESPTEYSFRLRNIVIH